jgi:hypothetical protein
MRRSSWIIRMGLKSNDKCLYKTKGGLRHIEDRGKRMIQPQAKKVEACQQPSEARKGQKFYPRAFRRYAALLIP